MGPKQPMPPLKPQPSLEYHYPLRWCQWWMAVAATTKVVVVIFEWGRKEEEDWEFEDLLVLWSITNPPDNPQLIYSSIFPWKMPILSLSWSHLRRTPSLAKKNHGTRIHFFYVCTSSYLSYLSRLGSDHPKRKAGQALLQFKNMGFIPYLIFWPHNFP